jgi:tight adherence protein C
MFTATDIASFLMAFFIIYFTLKIFLKSHEQAAFKSRLEELMSYKETLLKQDASATKAYRRYEKQTALGRLMEIIQLKEEREKLKEKFEKADIKAGNALIIYGIAKIISMFIAGTVAFYIVFEFTKLEYMFKVLIVIASSLLGSFVVDIVLNLLVRARQERILNAFPNALDLMVICAEAGLSLTATIQRVAREISQISPDLGYELALLSIELNMLPDRRKALQNFGNRLTSEYFRSIVSNIAQAEQYGTPIAETMRVVAEEFRSNRLLVAEEKAGRLPALLSLPMMIFIFPCIYLIVMGPAILKVMQSFK